ncbi:MAG: YCF48-related protein, partial [Ignavibacteria bacterium]|nr:YCF48-related protein [Ignavibacteria bacterium]
MDKLFPKHVVFVWIIIIKLIFPQGTMFEVYPRIPSVDYYGVHFISPDSGLAFGENGTIIRTTDGGENWEQIVSPVNVALMRAESNSRNKIFLCGGYGTILQTTDLGESWETVDLGISVKSYFLGIKV